MSNNGNEQELKDQLFVIKLKEFLDDERCEEAAKYFEVEDDEGRAKRSLWELVPVLSSRLNKLDKVCHRSVFSTCESLLLRLTNKCNTRETLLLLLEELRRTQDEVTFACITKLLRHCVIRTGPKCSVDWCVRSIKNYVKRLPQPENRKPRENEEEATEDNDPIADRLLVDYESILSFLEPIVEYAALGETQDTKTRNYLLGTYLFLFGSPFCYLNHESSRIKTLFETTLTQMSKLTGNFFAFLRNVEERSLKRKKRLIRRCDEDDDGEDNIEFDMFRGEITDLAYANYYYYVLNTEEGRNNTPHIYDPIYLSRDCFYLANCLLREPEYVLVSKGLRIVEAILGKIDKFAIGHETLEIPIYRDLFAGLSQVMIYCDADIDRKLALRVFRSYVDCFDMRGRYLVILHLYETSNHSGLLSLLIDITKSSIIHCLEQVPRCEDFLGKKLERLLKRICHLSNGSATDLVEIADEVISALNLLRFLTIRDRDDTTGIWRTIVRLENDYLTPLLEGINLARAHWKVKIRDLEEQRKTMRTEETDVNDKDITVSVGGQELPMMPDTEKIKFCHQALNALDVMESILTRVNECVEANRTRIVQRSREN